MKTKIGFIGLGLMGSPMAKNILKAGFPLSVYNRTLSKTKELEKLGASVAKSPSDLASNVDILITMVTAPKDVEEVLFGKNGVIQNPKKGLVVIDMSTIGKKVAEDIGVKLAKNNIEFLDAPVTGGTPRAISGELVIYIGGKESTFKKATPVLLSMGKTLHHIGPIGSGQGVKLINNHLIAAGMVALSEGMLLADAMKLPRSKVCDAIQSAPIVSKQMIRVMPNYVNNNFPTVFSIANLKKDLLLALAELKDKKMLKLLFLTASLYKTASKKNHDNEDYSSIIKTIKNS